MVGLGLTMSSSALAQDELEAEDVVVEDAATPDANPDADQGTAEAETPAADDAPEVTDALPGEYVRELLSVEESVHGLKERVFRSKATLQLLKELVVEGATLGSRVNIWHVNRFGRAYVVESIQYFLDGKNIYSKVDPDGGLGQIKEIKVREQTVAPGTHSLQVHLVLRGNGYGIFSYVKAFEFKVQSSYSFDVDDGKLTTLRVIAGSRGGKGKSFVDRPNVQYEERSELLGAE